MAISKDLAINNASASQNVDIIVSQGASGLTGVLNKVSDDPSGVKLYQFNINNLPNNDQENIDKLLYHKIYINQSNYMIAFAGINENNSKGYVQFYTRTSLALSYYENVGIHLGVDSVKISAVPLDSDDNPVDTLKKDFIFNLNPKLPNTSRIIRVPIIPKYRVYIVPMKGQRVLSGINGAVKDYDLTQSEPSSNITVVRTPENLRVTLTDSAWKSSTCVLS